MLQPGQQDLARQSHPYSRREAKQGKRAVSELLAQGDFFGGSGKLGYYYQDRNFLCEVEFAETAPGLVQQVHGAYQERVEQPEGGPGPYLKRLRAEGDENSYQERALGLRLTDTPAAVGQAGG